MTRDMDLLRDILLALEANGDLNGQGFSRGHASEFFISEGVSAEDVAYQMMLLIDRDYLLGSYDPTSGTFDVQRLTMDGHDFVDTIRDPDVWAKTKQGADAVKSWSLETLQDIGKGLIKKQIEEYTGVKLG